MTEFAAQYDLVVSTKGTAEVIALQKQVQQFTAEMQKAQTQTTKFSKPADEAAKASAALGRQLGGVSTQLGDMAVQFMNGAGGARALSQQLPQLLGYFGAFGAVAGALSAVLVPVAADLLGFNDKVKSAGELAEAAADQVGKLSSAIRGAGDSTAAGAFTEQLERLARLKVGVELAKSQTELQAAIRGIGSEIKNQVGNVESFIIAAGNIQSALSGVAPELLILENGFTSFRGAISATTDRTRDIVDLTAGLRQLGLSADLAFVQARQMYDAMASGNVLSAVAQFEQLTALLMKFGMATEDAKKVSIGLIEKFGQLSGAAYSYQRSVAAALELQMRLFSGVGSYGPSSAESGSTLPSAEEQQKIAAARQAAAQAAAQAAQAASKAAAEYSAWLAVIERSKSPMDQATAQLADATAKFEQFNAQMSPEMREQAAAYIDSLKAKVEELSFDGQWNAMAASIQNATGPLVMFHDQVKALAQTIQDSLVTGLTDAFMAFVEGTKSAEDAFKEFAVSFLKQITAMIVKSAALYAIQTALGMALPGQSALRSILGVASVYAKGGAFQGGKEIQAFANGGAFQGGKVQAFANGGVVASPMTFPMAGGKTGLMGEAGPEAIMPLTRRNGRLGVEGSPVNVKINNYSSASVTAKRNAAGEIDIDVIERELGARVARGGSPLSKGIETGYAVRRNGR